MVFPLRRTLIVATPAVELTVYAAVENWTLTAFDKIAPENCDVSPAVRTGATVLKLVAVAVINELEATTEGKAAENVTDPLLGGTDGQGLFDGLVSALQ